MRTVPGGWVSRSIVEDTRPGDRWQISSPRGDLRIDEDGPAVVVWSRAARAWPRCGRSSWICCSRESAAGVPVRRGPHRHDLYASDMLWVLTQQLPWLTTVPIVEDVTDPGGPDEWYDRIVAEVGPVNSTRTICSRAPSPTSSPITAPSSTTRCCCVVRRRWADHPGAVIATGTPPRPSAPTRSDGSARTTFDTPSARRPRSKDVRAGPSCRACRAGSAAARRRSPPTWCMHGTLCRPDAFDEFGRLHRLPSRSTTHALTASPHFSSGTPTTATDATAGCPEMTSSISRGNTLKPR